MVGGGWSDGPVVAFIIVFSAMLLQQSHAQNSSNIISREKRQGLFQVVKFQNTPCSASNGLNGTCVSASECDGTGGEAAGSCAQGFGTCCFYSIATCGGDIRYNQTYIQNINYPGTYIVNSDQSCTFTFYRQNDNVCQIRLDFEKFELGGPFYPGMTLWQCHTDDTDYVTFSPAGNRNNGVVLCGYNTGQHLYIDMGTSSANPVTASMTMKFDADNQATFNRKYNIMVSQIECNTLYSPPQGCSQYFYGNGGRGLIQSFNYENPVNTYRNKIPGWYTVCVRREENMCMIGYVPPDVSIEPLGFSITGGPNVRGRLSCAETPTQCTNNFIRIPQGTDSNGNAPFYTTNSNSKTGCDRYCGKRMCHTHGSCDDSHQTIYSRLKPFRMEVWFDPSDSTKVNYGFKLNYFQRKCD